MGRKWPSIDLLKLYSGTYTKNDDVSKNASWEDSIVNTADDQKRFRAHVEWNQWLSRCLSSRNIQELMSTRYGLQAGMDDLSKKNLVTPEITDLWIRWCRSIEKTAAKIVALKNPVPKGADPATVSGIKKRRAIELEVFFRESAF
jgi:hypothetical protein